MSLRRRTLRSLFVMALVSVFFAASVVATFAQPRKVVLQSFWWDWKNNNYQNGLFNYLADLAPRLKDLGVDAVWVPSAPKGAGTPDASGWVSEMGYSIFDHYDLGDKYQKLTTKTRFGTKDEYLRMIAVMHANGVEVIQDIVLNHIGGAGAADATGSGGQDAYALANYNDGSTQGYKNFRYASYATPATAETATNYLNRSGRWQKNWENFYPNQLNNHVNTSDIDQVLFGPDVSYENNAYGGSSCVSCYNPAEAANYMYDGARNWAVWFKKQAGFDGVRLDAVKHFPTWVTDAVLNDLQNNAGWASGTSNMFAVGEWVGSIAQMDSWCTAVNNRSGTFDFNFRGAIYGMVTNQLNPDNNLNYDMSQIPGAQQTNRQRTVPFVNNHDSYRPTTFDASGNITGWDTGHELVAHIGPTEPRLAAAYAIACAVDGSPQIFFEDLFTLNTTTRLSHQPTSSVDLPVRDEIANIIRCSKKFDFPSGAYKVRTAGNGEFYTQGANNDALVIERSAKALIGASDSWATEQIIWVNSDFPAGTVLKDYGGSYAGVTRTVQADKRVQISIPPCNGTKTRRGYAIWAPTSMQATFDAAFSPVVKTTSQEWELANDLGDSHASSLQQGGALPASSTALRTAGRIFAKSGSLITVNLYPSDATKNLTVCLYNGASLVTSQSGTGNLTLTYTPASNKWYTIKAKNTSSSNPSQKVWAKATYTGVPTPNTAANPPAQAARGNDEGVIAAEADADAQTLDAFETNLTGVSPNPIAQTGTVNFSVSKEMLVKISIYNTLGQAVVSLTDGVLKAGAYNLPLDVTNLSTGLYIVHLQTPERSVMQKIVIRK